MALQRYVITADRLVLVFLLFSITGCGNQTMRDYAKLTSQTSTDLDSKLRLYANSASDFDATRQEDQRRIESQNNIASDGTRRAQSDWALVGDKSRPALFKQLQSDSEDSLAIQLRPAPSTAALTQMKSPPQLTDVAKTTDQLSRNQSTTDQVKEVFAYSKEVYGDLKSDKASKSAEGSLTQGVKKTPPSN
jgi:hypothetical protein